jgi:glycerol-3-phosphate cytidylyltransferase
MRVIYHAGVWDLFHAGHLDILERSKALGDLLVVGVVSDEGAAAYKDRAPVVSQDERLRIVSALRCVDAAYLQPGTDPTPVLELLAAQGDCPRAMVHGDDWRALREGQGTLDRLGIELVLLPYGPGRGTTGLIERIREAGS